jgi:hypothetical protein
VLNVEGETIPLQVQAISAAAALLGVAGACSGVFVSRVSRTALLLQRRVHNTATLVHAVLRLAISFWATYRVTLTHALAS